MKREQNYEMVDSAEDMINKIKYSIPTFSRCIVKHM